jgi:glycosyltransferase involved in cell wall biosynthesis
MTIFPSIVIGVIPRERFALTGEVLRRITRCTREPHRLIVVDCAMPECYRHEIETIVDDIPRAEILHIGRYLLPNESRNRVIEASREEYVCLIDNDVLVKPGWLSALIDALEGESAGVARPYVIEGLRHHFDPTLGPLEFTTGVPSQRVRVTRPTRREEFDPRGGRRLVEWMEMHCLLFRRTALDQIGLLDPELNTREHVDLALSLRAAGITTVFQPASQVRFVPPPPIQAEERPFFSFRWDLDRAIASHSRIKSRWNLVGHRLNLRWLRERHWRTSRPAHWLRQALKPVDLLLELLDDTRQGLKHGRGILRDYLAKRHYGNLAGVQSSTFKIDIQEGHTRYFQAGAITFAVEARLPPATDIGISLHVFSGTRETGLIERLRFDCLQDKPHYHYVLHDQGISQKFWLDPLLVADPKAWSLQRIRHDLKAMLDAGGGCELAALVDQNELERVFPELEAEMHRAEALTQVSDARTHMLKRTRFGMEGSSHLDSEP